MRKALALLIGLLCLSLPARAAGLTTPVQLGVASGTTTAVITTGADAPIGSLIVVIASVGSQTAVTSVVDSQTNCTTYTALDNATVVARPTVAVFYCANTASDLASGQTITITVPSSSTVSATAFAVAGMAASPVDIHATQKDGASGTAATATTTPALAQPYELIVGGLALQGNVTGFAPGSLLTSIGGTNNANQSVYAAYQITCPTTGGTFAPTWGTSAAYMSDTVTFKVDTAAESICSSKANAYPILAPGTSAQESASKVNAYPDLNVGTAGQQSSSKQVTYVILDGTPPAGWIFHSFPP